tara:strand:+ start:756 stop:1049 length:294 start_codon:yes stop_codon:yes gene_type:complete
MIRTTQFIKVSDKYWLSKPTSWCGGWARSIWFKRSMQTQNVHIASKDFWDQLAENHQVMVLSESDGVINVSTSHDGIEFKREASIDPYDLPTSDEEI